MARIANANIEDSRQIHQDSARCAGEKLGARRLLNHLIYARRPSIFRGARAMWTGIDSSGLIDAELARPDQSSRSFPKRL